MTSITEVWIISYVLNSSKEVVHTGMLSHWLIMGMSVMVKTKTRMTMNIVLPQTMMSWWHTYYTCELHHCYNCNYCFTLVISYVHVYFNFVPLSVNKYFIGNSLGSFCSSSLPSILQKHTIRFSPRCYISICLVIVSWSALYHCCYCTTRAETKPLNISKLRRLSNLRRAKCLSKIRNALISH